MFYLPLPIWFGFFMDIMLTHLKFNYREFFGAWSNYGYHSYAWHSSCSTSIWWQEGKYLTIWASHPHESICILYDYEKAVSFIAMLKFMTYILFNIPLDKWWQWMEFGTGQGNCKSILTLSSIYFALYLICSRTDRNWVWLGFPCILWCAGDIAIIWREFFKTL